MKSLWREVTDPPTIKSEAGLWQSERVLLWVANAGPTRKGAVAFGYRIGSMEKGLVYRAEGYGSTGWNIMYWMPLPSPPNQR